MTTEEIDRHTQTLHADRLERTCGITEVTQPDAAPTCSQGEDYDGQEPDDETFAGRVDADRRFARWMLAVAVVFVVGAGLFYAALARIDREDSSIVNRVTSEQRRQMSDRQEIFSR